MRHAVYDKYKESCVEWLGKVPEHWIVRKIKWDSPVFRGASPRPIDDPVYFDDEGEYAWVRIADVTASGKYLNETTQRLSHIGASLSVKLQPYSLFLSIAGSVGKPCISNIKCCIHDGFVYFPFLKLNQDFLYYVFVSGEPYKGLGKLGTQLNLNTETVGSIQMAIPTKEEQNSIVSFLDKEIENIEKLIEKKQTFIDTLKEKRISIISNAVTKGLKTDAVLKDSQIEWLGQIPNNWDIKRLKYATNLINQKTETTEDSDELSMQYIGLENIIPFRGEISIGEVSYSPDGISNTFKKDDVLFGKLRPYLAKAFIAGFDGICTSELLVLRPNNLINKEFLLYVILSDGFLKLVNSSTYGSKMPRASWDFIGSIVIPIPNIEEQLEIVEFLKFELVNIDKIIYKTEQAIEKIEEYKTALISSVVTGKIKVQE